LLKDFFKIIVFRLIQENIKVLLKLEVLPIGVSLTMLKGENTLWVTTQSCHNLIIGHGTKIK
jgi:hypothetical protein